MSSPFSTACPSNTIRLFNVDLMLGKSHRRCASVRSALGKVLFLCASLILPLVTGPVHSCTISTPFLEHTALQPFQRYKLITDIAISVLPGTHLHLSQVKHVRVECLAQRHSIEIMPQHCPDIGKALAIAPRPSLPLLLIQRC